MKRRYFKRTIGIFQKEFSQVRLSSGKFPSQNFPSDNFSNVQFPKRQLLKDYVRPYGAPQEQKHETRPSAADMIDLGCCRLGNCTFLSLRKIILGSSRLGKYLTSIPVVGLFLPLYITPRYCGGTRGGG